MQSNLTREQALSLLKTYNKEPFHIQHALTVEGVMRWYAGELGYGDDADYWATVGLLHDIGQTALVPIYLKDAATRWWEIRHIRTVFTIHNIEYQGRYGSDSVDL